MNQDVDLAGAVEPRTTIHAGTLGALERAMIGVNKLMMLFGMIALLVASFVLTYSVFSRYLFKAATDWQDEVAVFCIVGAVFLAVEGAQAHCGHIGIEAVSSMLSGSVNPFLIIVTDFHTLALRVFFTRKYWSL